MSSPSPYAMPVVSGLNQNVVPLAVPLSLGFFSERGSWQPGPGSDATSQFSMPAVNLVMLGDLTCAMSWKFPESAGRSGGNVS